MDGRFARTALILGREGLERLSSCRVIVFGIGGVGGYAVEALVRSGIGAIDLVDNDTVSLSNLNRQIIALESTIGQYKTDAAMRRILDINPDCKVTVHRMFYMPETAGSIDLRHYDYVVDCIDTVTAKLELIARCTALGVPVISSMGTGNKLDPSKLQIADISKTSVCPLARVMRTELRKRGINRLKCVFSTEQSAGSVVPSGTDGADKGRHAPGSIAFVPAAAGLLIASAVVRDLCGMGRES